ncbi:helix-turn-helix domain-containing protein [Kitasatospora sp. NPDC058965]|uniref:helix-turn-helix domain-containing protein n=1 Tax=Kitasatospora sp. NPDC058965 TaxID=3346682 RepID=UPI0036CB62EF
MPRPEKPVDPNAPYAALALHLRAARSRAGSIPLKSLARKTGYSIAALSEAASGRRRPTLALTTAYGTACGGEREFWIEQWQAAGAPAHTAGQVRPVRVTPPEPSTARTVAEFVQRLRDLKVWAGNPSYDRISYHHGRAPRDGGVALARSTQSDALSVSRSTLPGLQITLEFVWRCLSIGSALRGRRDDLADQMDQWADAWTSIARAPAESEPEAPAAALRPPSVDEPTSPRPVLLPPAGELSLERRQLAEVLRQLFETLNMSVRRFAARWYYDAGTVSRYLSGRRIPPQEFVEQLIKSVEEQAGIEVTQPVRSHIFTLLGRARAEAQLQGGHLAEPVSDYRRRLQRELAGLERYANGEGSAGT